MTVVIGHIPEEWWERRGTRRVTYDREALERYHVLVPVLEDTGEALVEVRDTALRCPLEGLVTLEVEFVGHEPYTGPTAQGVAE